MTNDEPRRSFVPLLVGGAVAVSVMIGYAKYRFDRIEQLAQSGRPAHPPVSSGTEALDEAPAITYREVYVPIDTQVRQRDGKKIPLEATLIIRNTNPESPLIIKTVELFGTDGKRIRRVTEGPLEVRPFAKVQLAAVESTSGEVQHVNADKPRDMIGAPAMERSGEPASPSHFIVQWGSRVEAEAPLIEAMMVDEGGHLLYARPGRDVRVLHPEYADPRNSQKHFSLRKQDGPSSNVSAGKSAHREPLSNPKWHASLAPEPKYELLRYDSDMGLRPKNP